MDLYPEVLYNFYKWKNFQIPGPASSLRLGKPSKAKDPSQRENVGQKAV